MDTVGSKGPDSHHWKRTKKQPTLFELMGYSYQVIVTNIEWMSP